MSNRFDKLAGQRHVTKSDALAAPYAKYAELLSALSSSQVLDA